MTKMIIDFALNYKIAQVQLYYIVFFSIFCYLMNANARISNYESAK